MQGAIRRVHMNYFESDLQGPRSFDDLASGACVRDVVPVVRSSLIPFLVKCPAQRSQSFVSSCLAALRFEAWALNLGPYLFLSCLGGV